MINARAPVYIKLTFWTASNLSKFNKKPKNIFLVHGNKEALTSFSKIIKNKLNINSKIVKFREENILN